MNSTYYIFINLSVIKFRVSFAVEYIKRPGPSCSKLMKSLVNVSLKFQKLTSEICLYFLLKKCEKLLHSKNLSHFFNKK